jgi:hypothetical protein
MNCSYFISFKSRRFGKKQLTFQLFNPYVLFIGGYSIAGAAAIHTFAKKSQGRPWEEGRTLNNLDWFAQLLLAAVFFIDGFRRILVCSQQTESRPSGPGNTGISMSFGAACLVGLAEIAGALGLIAPVQAVPFMRPDFLPLLASGVLALLTLAALLYRARRKEPTAPVMALCLLVLLAAIGRWA